MFYYIKQIWPIVLILSSSSLINAFPRNDLAYDRTVTKNCPLHLKTARKLSNNSKIFIVKKDYPSHREIEYFPELNCAYWKKKLYSNFKFDDKIDCYKMGKNGGRRRRIGRNKA